MDIKELEYQLYRAEEERNYHKDKYDMLIAAFKEMTVKEFKRWQKKF